MIDIRPATSNDAAALASLAETIFRDTFTTGTSTADMDLYCARSFGPEIQQKEILDTGLTTLLAQIDRELVAYAQVRLEAPHAAIAAKRPSELCKLYVRREWQGRGVAQGLMTQAMATAAGAGADYIWLGVWEHNPKAIAFYRKYAFKPVGEKIFQLGDDAQRDLILGTALPPR